MGFTRLTLHCNSELIVEGPDSFSVRETLAACQMLGIRSQLACGSSGGVPHPLLAGDSLVDMWVLVDEPAAPSRVREVRSIGYSGGVYVVGTLETAPDMEVEALEAGADGYSGSRVDRDTLAARLRSTLRRNSGTYATATPTKLKLKRASRVLLVGSREHVLSPREFAVVEYLQARAGQWVPRDDLLQHVFGAQNGYDSSLVRTHILNIRRKLAEDSWLLRADRLNGVMLVAALEDVG